MPDKKKSKGNLSIVPKLSLKPAEEDSSVEKGSTVDFDQAEKVWSSLSKFKSARANIVDLNKLGAEPISDAEKSHKLLAH